MKVVPPFVLVRQRGQPMVSKRQAPQGWIPPTSHPPSACDCVVIGQTQDPILDQRENVQRTQVCECVCVHV